MVAYLVVELAPLEFHVDGALVTDGAAVCDCHEVFVAGGVHVVATQQTDDGQGRGEEVVQTQRAVAIGSALDARMCAGCRDGDADVAALAVDIVFAQSLSPPTDAAVVAVVYSLRAVIVPQLALGAVVVCRLFSAVDTLFSGGLRRVAKHAQHVLGHFAVQLVGIWKVGRRVVAMAAGEPEVAVVALHLDVAAVVLATQCSPSLILGHVLFIADGHMDGTIRSFQVGGLHVVRVVFCAYP